MYVYTGSGKLINLNTGGAAAPDTSFTPWDDVLHRGWHEGVPDNTLPAYYLMKQKGYYWGECDVRLSADGIPVLCHDSTVTGTLNGVSTTLTVAESNAADITALVLKKHATFGDIHPCTLAELLELARTIDIGIVIDFKSCAAFYSEPGATAVANAVMNAGCSDRVVYMPITTNNAQWIQAIDKNASFDFVSGVIALDKLPDLAPYQALRTGSNTVGFDFQAGIGDDVLQAVKDAGLSISFWNVSNTSQFEKGAKRITYNSYSNAHLGRDYIRQKQSDLAAKYPAI